MHTRNLCALLFLTSALVGACGEDAKRGGDPYPLELQPTSVSNVLTLFREAYQGRDYDRFRRLFDSSFVFAFAPQDIGGPQNIPAEWGLADEMLSVEHMFGDAVNRDGYRTEEILLSFTAGPEVPTERNPSWRKVVLSNVILQISARHETTNDPLSYQVIGDKAELYFFESSETVPGTNLRIWRIVRWDDKPISRGTMATQDATWGRIKAVWR